MDKKTIEIDLLEVLGVLWNKFFLLVVGGVVGAVIAFAVTWFLITPKYQSTASFYVNNKAQDENTYMQYYSTTDLDAAQSLVGTYLVILKERPTLERVIEVCNLPYTTKELSKMISAEAVNETEIFAVTVTSTDPMEAETIVNAIADVLPEQIAQVVEGASVHVVSRGKMNLEPVSPSYKINLVIGFLIGLLIMIMIILVKYYTDNKVHDENFVKNIPEDYPLLATIPDLLADERKKNKKGYGYDYGYESADADKKKDEIRSVITGEEKLLCGNVSFSAAESYKLLRTNILYALTDKEGCTVIGVTSSMRGEAKSTTAINIAYSFAETGKKVLLIEADMRLPVIANRLNLNPIPGLSNRLGGFTGINEVLQPSKMKSNWYVITAGDTPPNPAELLESKQMEKLVEICRHYFDHVIIDLPPVCVVSDALVVTPYIDGLVLVAREEYTDMQAIYDSIEKIQFSEGNLLGFVLTDSTTAQKTNYRGIGHNKVRGYGYYKSLKKTKVSK